MTERPELRCFSLLRERKTTFAAAESCTGGLIAKRITDIPGASEVFPGGVVSYTNGVKARLLGVSEKTLAEAGAVSAATAREMAEGVRRAAGADIGVSVTGLAGPSGDDRGNPVGTVFLALADERGTVVRHFLYEGGDRESIRTRAADDAFSLLAERLTEK